MVNLRFQGRKAERAKRDMAGVAENRVDAAESQRLKHTVDGFHGKPTLLSRAGSSPASRPNHFLDATKMVDLVIALLTGIVVMGVSV